MQRLLPLCHRVENRDQLGAHVEAIAHSHFAYLDQIVMFHILLKNYPYSCVMYTGVTPSELTTTLRDSIII